MSTSGEQWLTLWLVPGEILPLGSSNTEPCSGLPIAVLNLLPLPQTRPQSVLVAEQSCCDLPAVPSPESCTCNTLGSSGDWLTVLRVFGHGLCAWRYSNPALNPWSAPWMLRISDCLPSTR